MMRYYSERDDLNGDGGRDRSQLFVALGPAVSQKDWENGVVNYLELDVRKNQGYVHDEKDLVRYVTTPRSLLDIPKAIWHVKDIKSHFLSNDKYLKHLRTPEYLYEHGIK